MIRGTYYCDILGAVGIQELSNRTEFAITAGNTGGAFAIDPTTGAITVANAAALDFETTPSFTLTVQVTDAGGLTGHRHGDGEPHERERGAGRQRPGLRAAGEQRERHGGRAPSRRAIVDAGDTRSYAITAGNTGGAFAIDPSDGRDHRRERRGARLRDDAELRADGAGDGRRRPHRTPPR